MISKIVPAVWVQPTIISALMECLGTHSYLILFFVGLLAPFGAHFLNADKLN